MSAWIVIGMASAMMISLLVGLIVAAVLGQIGRELSELLENEAWSSAPLMDRP